MFGTPDDPFRNNSIHTFSKQMQRKIKKPMRQRPKINDGEIISKDNLTIQMIATIQKPQSVYDETTQEDVNDQKQDFEADQATYDESMRQVRRSQQR